MTDTSQLAPPQHVADDPWWKRSPLDGRGLLTVFAGSVSLVGACVVLLPVFLVLFRRWHDWVFLAGALIVEVAVFITVSTLVGRARPPVAQLDSAPTDSFPSGHVAAAVVFYVGLAVVVAWHTRDNRVRAPFVALAVVAPSLVIVSRLYRGMHYVTDVLGGLAVGLGALAVMWLALERSAAR